MALIELEIILIAIVVASACAIPGVFLILRKMALMSDAISHAILLGIVLAFFVIKDIQSPILILGASIAGILTVALTELVIKTNRIKEDAAIGFIFPIFFSIGVILISKFAGDVHLDTDAVLLGEMAFAPFERFYIHDIALGPKSLWVMGTILLLNLTFIGLFYKELKIATFDKALSKSLGFSPLLLHYGLMFLVSITAVGAFDAVGSILVVALMITPPATAYLLTESLSKMIGLSVFIGMISAVTGYGLAGLLDASIAGSMATMTGVIFLLAFIFSPNRGVYVQLVRQRQQKLTFASHMLTVQLFDHEGQKEEAWENTVSNMIYHMGWSPKFAKQVTAVAIQNKLITRQKDHLTLTPLGRETAKTAMTL